MTSTSATSLLLLCVICSLIGQTITQDATVSFNIIEERPIRTYVGSVALSSELFTSFNNERFDNLQFQILVPGNKYVGMFDLEMETGLLWTNEVIDREDLLDCILTCQVDFNVAVYEKNVPEPINIIKVIVEIDDDNDNSPKFFPDRQEIIVSEASSIGSELLRRSAIDLDQGAGNSVKIYTMFPETETFKIDTLYNDETEFSIRLMTALDHETVNFFQVVVLAKDGGTPQRTGTLTVDITVTDYNDNPPRFNQDLFELSLDENVRMKSTVLVLYASDKDIDENAEITYRFSGRVSDKITDLFNINDTTGEITVAGPIDYEVDKRFEFTIYAVDHGTPSKTGTAHIVVNVNDLNDNYPQINLNQPPGGTVLSETADIESFVAHVEIIDLDEGKNGLVTCKLLDNHFKLVDVGIENNYKIVLNRSLDHEKQTSHNVSIVCQDSGDEPQQSTANFIVHVENMNDNVPVFTKNIYTVTIEENNWKGSFVVEVSANDLDRGSFGQVSYSFHPDSDGSFTINPFTGVISTNVSLDRDETHGDQMIFRVLAKDGGKPPAITTGTVVVNIMDQNDNDPTFERDPYVLNITENKPKDTVAGIIRAKDIDKDVNGTFYFVFPSLPNVTDYFHFNASGFVFTSKRLDRETLDKHEFYVYAMDKGGRTSSVVVTVNVLDQNDNVPQVIYPINHVQHLPYTSSPGDTAAQVLAEDRDMGDNALLHFTIDQDNATHTFNLNEYTGKLVLNSTLSTGDIGKVFHFLIKVTDSGYPPLLSWATVNLEITKGEPVYSASSSTIQSNFWIVIAIVAVTIVLSIIMVVVILKICWVNRKKGGSRCSSNIILESGEVNPKLIDSSSSSAGSTCSKDSNANEKILYSPSDDGYQQQDAGFQSGQEETGSVLNTTLSSVDKNMVDRLLYMEKVKEVTFDPQRKLDETNSDNSGEMGTRDSGQGGSDVDLNSLTESPPSTELQDGSSFSEVSTPTHKTYLTDNFSGGNYGDVFHDNHGFHDNHDYYNQDYIERPPNPQTLANYHGPPHKTAERKELSRLKRGQKRVMFSDDLENSHSSGRSSTMSAISYSDINTLLQSVGQGRQLGRMLSYDPSVPSGLIRDPRPQHRSVDNLTLDNHYNQRMGLWSENQIQNNTRQSVPPHLQLHNTSLGRKPWTDISRNYPVPAGPAPVFSIAPDYQRSSSSQENASTTTSGSYNLTSEEISLSPMDNVFPEDLYV